MASILMLGLDHDMAERLSQVLRGLSHDVIITNSLAESLRDRTARVIFAAGDSPRYREIVQKLTSKRPDAAVILVNRHPDDGRWLDALELGAADYCGAPFETAQIRWLVEGALHGLARTAAQDRPAFRHHAGSYKMRNTTTVISSLLDVPLKRDTASTIR